LRNTVKNTIVPSGAHQYGYPDGGLGKPEPQFPDLTFEVL
jgi:hypothetical protein